MESIFKTAVVSGDLIGFVSQGGGEDISAPRVEETRDIASFGQEVVKRVIPIANEGGSYDEMEPVRESDSFMHSLQG